MKYDYHFVINTETNPIYDALKLQQTRERIKEKENRLSEVQDDIDTLENNYQLYVHLFGEENFNQTHNKHQKKYFELCFELLELHTKQLELSRQMLEKEYSEYKAEN